MLLLEYKQMLSFSYYRIFLNLYITAVKKGTFKMCLKHSDAPEVLGHRRMQKKTSLELQVL